MATKVDQVNMKTQGSLRFRRIKGFLNLKGGLVLCCGVLAVVLLANCFFRFGCEAPSETPLDTQGWELTDLLEHLRGRGLQLRVLPDHKGKHLGDGAYLTEDPNETWESLDAKAKFIERMDAWHGSVWVGHRTDSLVHDQLWLWGANGCRIGNFVFFGDERILRQIQEACRLPRGG